MKTKVTTPTNTTFQPGRHCKTVAAASWDAIFGGQRCKALIAVPPAYNRAEAGFGLSDT